jgi:hypothetical protein
MKKSAMTTQKHCIPAIGIMVEASLTKSQETLPHGRVA